MIVDDGDALVMGLTKTLIVGKGGGLRRGTVLSKWVMEKVKKTHRREVYRVNSCPWQKLQ